jgi:hypothetical protein
MEFSLPTFSESECTSIPFKTRCEMRQQAIDERITLIFHFKAKAIIKSNYDYHFTITTQSKANGTT